MPVCRAWAGRVAQDQQGGPERAVMAALSPVPRGSASLSPSTRCKARRESCTRSDRSQTVPLLPFESGSLETRLYLELRVCDSLPIENANRALRRQPARALRTSEFDFSTAPPLSVRMRFSFLLVVGLPLSQRSCGSG
uniref:Uncharacterized protein n=1 Tax=Myotis myotis TaxID=51298 RepID=A0A7J8AM59_MYOMY|nr:hypothetical protein mMyoMyo1_008016 [Myotis myotis]